MNKQKEIRDKILKEKLSMHPDKNKIQSLQIEFDKALMELFISSRVYEYWLEPLSRILDEL